MDFSKLKKIRVYSDQIQKFKKLDSNKNLSGNEFHLKMKNIFPKFNSEYPGLFRNVCHGKDMHILDYMFKKLDDIEEEFNARKNEISYILPFINFCKEFLKDKTKVKKNRLISHIVLNKNVFPGDYKIFINRYPKIIDRMCDDEFLTFDPEVLLYEEVKFKHEVMVGQALKKEYIDPKLNQ